MHILKFAKVASWFIFCLGHLVTLVLRAAVGYGGYVGNGGHVCCGCNGGCGGDGGVWLCPTLQLGRLWRLWWLRDVALVASVAMVALMAFYTGANINSILF